ncbi:RHS repeat-associated core domain-containing protein [Andreprevotia lacus DSM 23236]|uniref:RHS repeat-associated core domain-containing protein n=1 Tax=Andreprevotia lacus DSM 23236 TaxID=1121001 RepID=A0A1W1XYQ6_9NEIS|nr:RHS repeat-associated core domain-containing protein [Andreprevotia lacus]SMC29053.1 RHS repeat-associated core domain-containing protein [Andreprevotia lacus DSM 23236]
MGRLLEANSALGKESFAFDPAGNLLDAKTQDTRSFQQDTTQFTSRMTGGSKLLDNLLRDYAGVHYDYDSRGNLSTRISNGQTTYYEWDHYNRLSSVRSDQVLTQFAYDPLGRRLYKQSSAIRPFNANLQWAEQEQARISKEKNLGITLYGWDGDTLAWESNSQRTTHYVFEPGSFVPLLQATTAGTIRLPRTPVWEGDYDREQDPLWQAPPEAKAFEQLHYYHCDHLGTPQELSDAQGNLAWQASYKAWGEAREVISDAAKKAGIHNPFRFQGQYYDHETGLHYNRHRYYDPVIGRFVSKDPIKLAGGLNLHVYGQNPTESVDPLGLCSTKLNGNLGGVTGDNMQAHHLIPEEVWGKHEVFFNNIGMGGQRDLAANGVLMPDSEKKAIAMKRKFYHCGSHGKYYSPMVNSQVQRIENDYNSGAISAVEAKTKIGDLQGRLRVGLIIPSAMGKARRVS